MTTLNTEAPPATIKATDFVKLAPFDKDGPQLLTLVGFNYIPSYEFENDKKEKYFAAAIEWYFGNIGRDGQPRFVKTWPKSYSIKNTAFYHKLYKAATGAEPTVGSKPSTLVGLAVQGTVSTKEKISRKGTKYRASELDLKSIAPVMDELKGSIVPLEKLKPALDAALAKSSEKADSSDSGSAPF